MCAALGIVTIIFILHRNDFEIFSDHSLYLPHIRHEHTLAQRNICSARREKCWRLVWITLKTNQFFSRAFFRFLTFFLAVFQTVEKTFACFVCFFAFIFMSNQPHYSILNFQFLLILLKVHWIKVLRMDSIWIFLFQKQDQVYEHRFDANQT